jgi:Ca2+-binding EF-hand superfamily protein
MATEATPSSSLTRSRPIILAIAGFAAAYGAYIVYTNFRNQPPSVGLQRKAAVRRGRRLHQPAVQENLAAEAATQIAEDVPDFGSVYTYGRWEITNGDGHPVHIELRPNDLPTLQSLQQNHGLAEAQARTALTNIYREFVTRFMISQFQDWSARGITEPDPLAATLWLEQLGIPESEVRQALEQIVHVVRNDEGANNRRGTALDDADTIAGTEVASVQFRRAGNGLNLKQLLYHIAENQARQDGFLHRGFRCDSCGTSPIRGTRWKCANCVDLDLCNDCHATYMHSRNHIFYEIKIPTYAMNNLHPVTELSYPGCVDMSNIPTLPANVCKDLVDKTDFEKAEIEGLYDQFTCLVSSPRNDDPLQHAIDRTAFQQAISPLSSNSPLRPNLIFDRIFALFDADRDGLVSFEEFILGVAFLRSRSRGRSRWKRVFEAYDIDEDGFVSRLDFLRIFKALYKIQKDITLDLLSRNVAENGLREAASFAVNGRVISSAFTQSPRSVGEPRNGPNKSPNEFGDVRHQPKQAVAKGNSPLDEDKSVVVANSWESQAQFPFDHSTGEALSLQDFLYRAPRYSPDQVPSPTARDQRVRFSYDGKSVAEARRAAWEERLERRNLYTNDRVLTNHAQQKTVYPGGLDIGQDLMHQVMEEGLNELLDPLFKAREDLAIEVSASDAELQQWKGAIELYKLKKRREQEGAERLARDPLIATATAAEKAANEQDVTTRRDGNTNGHPPGPTPHSGNRPGTIADTVTSIEEQVRAQSLGELLNGQGFGIRENGLTHDGESNVAHFNIQTQPERTVSMQIGPRLITDTPVFTAAPPQTETRFDPTMPQFMPNSEHDVIDNRPRDITIDPLRPPIAPANDGNIQWPNREAEIIQQFEHMFLGWERGSDGIVANGATKKTIQQMTANSRAHDGYIEYPSEERLARLTQLQAEKEVIKARGGPGKINFAEFEEFLAAAKGSDFKFLEGWFEVCYF